MRWFATFRFDGWSAWQPVREGKALARTFELMKKKKAGLTREMVLHTILI